MHYRAVIISPHLDDAVFTCGGAISRLTKEGPVLVINIFTRYLGDVRDRAIVMEDGRFDEEREAAMFLGYTRYNFGELEAYFRRKPYQQLHNIFHPPVADDMGEYLTDLRKRVFAYLDEIEYDELFIPLGIGWHVDHFLTFQLFEPWKGRKDITYYEDIPYALIPNSTRYRLDEIGVYDRGLSDETLRHTEQFVASITSALAYFRTALMRNLKPWYMPYVATPVVGYYFFKLMSMHYKESRMHPPEYRLTPIVAPVDDISHKIEAMSLYCGQFKEFFIDPVDCLHLYSTYAKRIDPNFTPLERFWKITSLSDRDLAANAK